MSRPSVTALSLTTITNEHLLNLEALCEMFETNLYRGLKVSYVKRILKENGKNKITRPKSLFTLDFGGLLERNSSKKERFSRSEWKRVFGQQLPNEVTVIRDGARKGVVAKNIVVGDLIVLETNDVVPADVRLIWSKDLIVDNRLITGNRYELRTHELDKAKNDALLSPNMIFACTRILAGECIGIALRTGEDTVFGTLKHFATKVKIEKRRYVSRSGSVNSTSNSDCGSTSSNGDSESRRDSELSKRRDSELSKRRDSELSTTMSNMYRDESLNNEDRRSSQNYKKKERSVSDCYVNAPTHFNIVKTITRSDSTDSVFF